MAGVLAIGVSAAMQAAESPDIQFDPSPISKQTRHETSFAPIVQKVSQSVVNVYTTRTIELGEGRNPLFDHPLFREFFEERRGELPPRQQQGLGSGVVITKDGYILTNNHVVEDADTIKVGLPDGRTTLEANLIGRDPQTDLAVLKVEASDLSPITITDSDELEVGDAVLAIGNPFNIGQTVSSGIVSAKSRGGFGMVRYEDFIQTDASINPGNSGGALVDAEGRLVGINTWIISSSRGSQGIGFAIPSNMARNVLQQIIERGEVTRGYLGVYLQPESLTPELAERFGVKNHQGALVTQVSEGTPADKAGIKPGDVIVKFNGAKITDNRNLSLLVSQTPPGSKATVSIVRDGEERKLEVTLAELPDDLFAQMRPGGRGGPRGPSPSNALQGVEVSDITSEFRQQFNIPDDIKGALVTGVRPGTAAARKGIRPGDVILGIDRQPVNNADDAIQLSRAAEGDKMLLRIWSGGSIRYVVVDIQKN